MDPKTAALLVKIVALFDSPIDGERNNAFTKAQELLEKHGQSMADVLEMLTTLGARASAVADFMDRAQGREPTANAPHQGVPDGKEGDARSARRQDQAGSLLDVIARYGSIEAALQPCPWEASLRGVVRHGLTFHAPPNERWTRSVYGYMPEQ